MAERPKRQRTSTSNFGVGKRENHDASGFYERFGAPVLSNDDTINPAPVTDEIWVHDAREMPELPEGSVALVVTSPPYFAGKAYEEALGEGSIPADYEAYLEMLTEVFAECARVLEPGGRIAVNVANLGRKPFRSLAADVTWILQDRLGLLLRGEVIWQKAKGAGGNCAWGSFQSATNPVLRDLTERVIIASKGRFDRAGSAAKRAKAGLPSQSTIGKDRFLDLTTDLWEFPPESATRVGHPAPFPVELPRRFIELYTFEGDLVLDPFMGSGSTAVAAVELGRRWAGYDTDEAYAQAARERIADVQDAVRFEAKRREQALLPPLAQEISRAQREGGERALGYQQRATADGTRAQELAELLLQHCGFLDRLTPKVKFDAGVEANFVGLDDDGCEWIFDVSGAFSSSRPGLERTDTLWKALGKAAVLRHELQTKGRDSRYVLLTTDVPKRGTAGAKALQAAFDDQLIWDVLILDQPETVAELLHYASGERSDPDARPDRPTAYR
jgi:site-specific DNA-methyltransferase (adenine-specific)